MFQETELSPSHLLEKVGQLEHLTCAGAEVPLQPVTWTVVRQVVPLGHTAAGGCPKEAETLWEACAGADSRQDLWMCGETGAGLVSGLVNMQVTHAGAVSS